ncbi:hypothetical protein MLD38_035913 [Melastoma candidum]|uniref:Uncharacterized protein n=1 Tax=Melastoma candidum TaxID=119954 RepID=A0ACB9LIF8_9MYRT|nr:hypothetical protein MLD38_035913 [Melastoma candidum]
MALSRLLGHDTTHPLLKLQFNFRMGKPIKKPKLQPPSLGIFWDTISCPIPDGVNPGDILDNIIAALRVHFPDYVLESFFVYGVPSDFKAHPLRPREGVRVKLCDFDGAYHLYKQILCDSISFGLEHRSFHTGVVLISTVGRLQEVCYLYRAAIVVPLSDPTARIRRANRYLLLLDWLWVSRGSGKIITKDDVISIAAAAPVARDAVAVEGSTTSVSSSGSGGRIQGVC